MHIQMIRENFALPKDFQTLNTKPALDVVNMFSIICYVDLEKESHLPDTENSDFKRKEVSLTH